ncbi:MAG: DUF2231 domain-containing protein [Anaerolineae bacterium]|nr:DUF2231 domain-containing protein [Anaerolineae bacterium]
MESRVKLFGHPIHPMLIVVPLGLLSIAFLFDVLYGLTGNREFAQVSFYNIVAGLIGGVVAGVFGFLDWLAIPAGTRAKRVGLFHALGNSAVTVLFFLSLLMRANAPDRLPDTTAFLLALVAVAFAGVSGWLGGELVDRLGVGVDRGANLDAPSSLSGEPADRTQP